MEEEESTPSLVSSIKWVKQGVANPNPQKVRLSTKEIKNIVNNAKSKCSKSSTDVPNNTSTGEETNPTDEFDFENYNDEDNDDGALGIDNLISVEDVEESDSEQSDTESDKIKPEDNLLLVARIQDVMSCLDIYVYNENEESFYVHHDILLSEYPLCIEWLNYEANTLPGNYCAVGSVKKIIEIWDLDIVNPIQPAFKLGKPPCRSKRSKRIGHNDGVLCLAWNTYFDHIMASGSADETIILWDMEHQIPSSTITAFRSRIQSLQWQYQNAHNLLAGSSGKTIKIFDCRDVKSLRSWKINGEVEQVKWCPVNSDIFYAGDSLGCIHCFDTRKGSIWCVEAHKNEITGLCLDKEIPDLLVTSSTDETIKMWNATESGATLITTKKMKVGMIHCLELCPNNPFIIGFGGNNKENNTKVFDLRTIDEVLQNFESRTSETESNN